MIKARFLFTAIAVACLIFCLSTATGFSRNDNNRGFGVIPKPAEESAVDYARWTPAIIYCDGVDSTKVEVYLKKSVQAVKLYTGSTFIADLNDSGTNGDAKAGDNVWTANGITSTSSYFRAGDYGTFGYSLKITSSGGATEVFNDMPSLGIVKKQRTQSWKVKKNVYASRYSLFLIDKKGVFLDGKLPICAVYCGNSNKKVFQEFYKYYKDSFDFVVVMPVCTIYRPVDMAENVPYCVPVQNKVQNIGVPIFDDTAEFGSKGRLKSVIYHSFGYGAILDHETGHNWGIRIGEALGFTGATCKYYDAYGWHYTPYANLPGQMGAFPQLELTDNGDGTYKAVKYSTGADYTETDRGYSLLTLYLMGLVDPSDVPPVMILTDSDYPNYNKIPANKFDTYTIQQIMDSNGGERIPAYPNTQKTFRMGLVVVTDHKPTPAEVDFFASLMKFFGSKNEGTAYLQPFYTATGGRGKMITKMPKAKVQK
jgi:hypothetical protein